MVRQSIQECGGRLGIAKHVTPFREGQIGCNDDAGPLIELGEQMKQQCATGLRERQISQLVQDHQIYLHQAERQLALFARGLLSFQRIDPFHGGVVTNTPAVVLDAGNTDRSRRL